MPIDEHTIQIAIADVAGKGVSAALLMVLTNHQALAPNF
jgi:serine phosphatase RsbU (regulator of sigma subunit)